MLRRTKRQLEHVSRTDFCSPGQQCCCDSEGLLLIGPPSGGTIDFVSPSSKIAVAHVEMMFCRTFITAPVLIICVTHTTNSGLLMTVQGLYKTANGIISLAI